MCLCNKWLPVNLVATFPAGESQSLSVCQSNPWPCRCLERILHKHTLQLSDKFDEAGPSPAEQDIVKKVIAEADDPEYWFAASKDGNHELHYRGEVLANIPT